MLPYESIWSMSKSNHRHAKYLINLVNITLGRSDYSHKSVENCGELNSEKKAASDCIVDPGNHFCISHFERLCCRPWGFFLYFCVLYFVKLRSRPYDPFRICVFCIWATILKLNNMNRVSFETNRPYQNLYWKETLVKGKVVIGAIEWKLWKLVKIVLSLSKFFQICSKLWIMVVMQTQCRLKNNVQEK